MFTVPISLYLNFNSTVGVEYVLDKWFLTSVPQECLKH